MFCFNLHILGGLSCHMMQNGVKHVCFTHSGCQILMYNYVFLKKNMGNCQKWLQAKASVECVLAGDV